MLFEQQGITVNINPFIAFIPLAAITAPAYAVQYFTTEEAQQTMFAGASLFKKSFLELNDDQRDAIEDRTDIRQRWKTQNIWEAYQGEEFLGWFVIDKVIGKHEFITYATALSPQGEVISIEIMDYRESYGDAVRMAPWRNQFKGENNPDNVRFNKEITNISGATLSCRNVTNGVRRILAIHDLYLKK